MKIFSPFLAVAILLLGASAASAADHWAGAWGYDVSPLPPGVAELPSYEAMQRADLMPMGAAPAPVPPSKYANYHPVVANPGHLDILPDTVTLSGVTVRQLVRVSAGGEEIRLRFTNEAGAGVRPLGIVHVAEAGADGAIVPGTDHTVTFNNGQPNVVIPASSPLLSDPVAMRVHPLEELLISVMMPGVVPRAGRSLYMYVTQTPGDNTAAIHLPDAKLARVSALVSEVDVETARPAKVLVTLGDSITEGFQSTQNAFRSWPDVLAARLAAAHKPWAVVNAGISGNRLLRYGAGPSALARFDRDVLSVPGVKAVILLEGINDIGASFWPKPHDTVTAATLEAADEQIIARAHAHGIKVYGALLTPYQGAFYATPEGEKVRAALNDWIKTGGAFDGVVDFAAAVADPANPLAFAPQYDSGDHLHPGDAGYKAMADSINLDMITR
jgi:lysophospholipase L1-like esterase